MGMFDKKGYGVIYNFIWILILFILCVYGVIYFDSLFVYLGCGVFLGLVWILSVYFGYDFGYYQIMLSRGYNKFVQLFIGNCFIGISMVWWKWIYNVYYIVCNSLDYDLDF